MEKIMFKELLKGDHISLKKHSLELAQTMFEYVDQDRERLRKFLPWVEFTKTVNDEVNYIQMTHDNWDEGKLFDYGIFNSEGVYVGNIGAHSIRWQDDACELGYWILGKYEGLGLMSRAVELLESHIFSLGFNRIQIRCSDLNARSARVPENTGYVYEGTARQDAVEMGAYRNTKTFSKLRSEHIA